MAGFNTISLKLKEMYQVLTELVYFLESFLLLSRVECHLHVEKCYLF